LKRDERNLGANSWSRSTRKSLFGHMNTIQLALVMDHGWLQDFVVEIHVDGEPLTERVRRIEAPYREASGSDPSESRYKWRPARDLLLPARHLLGVSSTPWCPGFCEVLVCNCGEAACGAIAVSVKLRPEYVGWLAWRQFPLAEAYPNCEFQPLVFRRSQYEEELTRVSEEYQLTK
jgi:hypothetical protein